VPIFAAISVNAHNLKRQLRLLWNPHSRYMVALATEQCAPVLVKVRHGLTTSDLRRFRYLFTIIEPGGESESVVNTADRVLSNLRDLPHGIDNIDAAIVHLLAERFRRNYRADVR
jgi:hypothetical protein